MIKQGLHSSILLCPFIEQSASVLVKRFLQFSREVSRRLSKEASVVLLRHKVLLFGASDFRAEFLSDEELSWVLRLIVAQELCVVLEFLRQLCLVSLGKALFDQLVELFLVKKITVPVDFEEVAS